MNMGSPLPAEGLKTKFDPVRPPGPRLGTGAQPKLREVQHPRRRDVGVVHEAKQLVASPERLFDEAQFGSVSVEDGAPLRPCAPIWSSAATSASRAAAVFPGTRMGAVSARTTARPSGGPASTEVLRRSRTRKATRSNLSPSFDTVEPPALATASAIFLSGLFVA